MVDVKAIKEKFISLDSERKLISGELIKAGEKASYWRKRHRDGLELRSIIQTVAESVQVTLEQKISAIMSLALDSISFDDRYKFLLEFVKKNNKTEAEIWLEKEGEKCKPLDSVGGGICDILSLSSTCTFTAMSNNRLTVCADEPLRNLSRNYCNEASQVLRLTCNKTHIQIIMVTHIPELIECADNVIEL